MITIYGNTPSKKNSKQIVPVHGRYIIISSKNYAQWHKEALKQLIGAKKVVTPTIPYIKFYQGTARQYDLTNKAESIMDLLVDAGIIPDDSVEYIPEIHLSHGGKDKENPRAEITFNDQKK